MSTQLFPEVIDSSTLSARVTSPVALPIAVEGQKDTGGTAVVATLQTISRASEADTLFGPASSLAAIVKFILDQGAGPVYAIASASAAGPTLVQRQAAWQILEADRRIRLRLTDSTLDADLAGMAVSVKNAGLLNHKQVAIVGKAVATTKAAYMTTADAIVSGDADGAKKTVLVSPGVYDRNGVLKSGVYTAAAVAARVALNFDPSDDLDTALLPNLTGIERDASGNDVFRQIVVAGVPQNDHEDLLQQGVSTVMPGINSGVAISHLRMSHHADSTFDALMTRLVMDQSFVLVRDYCTRFNALRKGNSETSREQLRSGVDALLRTLTEWIAPTVLGDGSTGFGVSVTASADQRQQIISYFGEIRRGVQTIVVAPSFTIAA